MLKLNARNAQGVYTAVQTLFWLTYGLMFAFAAVYLQNRGFSNGGIGVVLGCSYGLSTLLQPALAALFARRGICTERGLRAVYCLILLLSAVLLLAPLGKGGVAALTVLAFSLESALQPSVDTLARRWTSLGFPVDYGASRGLGSLVYAGMTAGMGALLQRISPRMIPAFYFCTMGLVVLILSLFAHPEVGEGAAASAQAGSRRVLVGRPRFLLFLCGVSCLSLGHVLVDNFMLQIMQNIGGNSANLGVAISIASLVEFPSMLLYSRLSKRFGPRRLLILSGWAWVVKNLLVFSAQTPQSIYLAEIMQFFSYGIYIPASIEYVAQEFSAQDNLKGQSFAGSAYTMGSIIATFVGGMLLDALGISRTLLLVAGVTLLGALLFAFVVRGGDGRSRSD